MAGFGLVYSNKNNTITRELRETVYCISRIVYMVTENTHSLELPVSNYILLPQ